MFYVMRQQHGVATRVGRAMSTNFDRIKRIAQRRQGAYVEQYGVGVVWLPGMKDRIKVCVLG